ncbi:MAG TPA: transporter [Anaerolineaceae bacterium]|nr:transporter [Anaerolineaceae bacterium]
MVTLKYTSLENIMLTHVSVNQIITRPQPWAAPQTGIVHLNHKNTLAGSIEQFEPISLAEMVAVALLNRVDQKFLISRDQLISILQSVQGDYRVLTINNKSLNAYRTLYFDTSDYKLYKLHVNQSAERYKVRLREYLNGHESYLEVKHKTRKDRTIKDRISANGLTDYLRADTVKWIKKYYPFDARELEPKIWNTFTRLTLVNRLNPERITIDTNLFFSTNEKYVNLAGLVVVEVKTDSKFKTSPFLAEMERRRIHPQGFSKYCIGISMLCDNVKRNELKEKILKVEKITKGVEIHG